MATTTPSTTLLDAAREQVAAYGYGINDEGRFTKAGRVLGVKLEHKGKGMRAVAAESGQVLWTGANAASFVTSFWHATKVTA